MASKMNKDSIEADLPNTNELADNTIANEYNEEITEQTFAKNQPIENRIDAEAKVLKDRGVYRVEASKEYLDRSKNGKIMKAILGTSIIICSWAIALDSSVTYSLQPFATSNYQRHSEGLGALNVANGIITAVSKPAWAQICNTLSRPTTYIISTVIYTVGYIIVAASDSFSAYIVGLALNSAGNAGISFINGLIVADLTILKWRSLATALLDAPYIINVWYAGYIVQDLEVDNWRWGYGMFAIIIPVVVLPTAYVLVLTQRKAYNFMPESEKQLYEKDLSFRQNWKAYIWRVLIEADLIGLLFLGFGFSLLLLPFSLESGAKDGWDNPSMIAMMVIGGVFLIMFTFWEVFWAPFPITPKRVLNRTVICCIVIDVFYQLAGMIPLVYYSSYAWIV